MGKIFEMPKLGMDMEEGTVLKWLKAEGDAVKKDEPLAEIETDKASVEVECPADGKLLKIFVPEQESRPCGEPIAFIGNDGEAIPDPTASATAAPAAAPAAPAPAPAPAPVVSAPAPVSAPVANTGKVRATPRARRLAAQNNVDLAYVTGTGANGRIVEADVRTAMQYGTAQGRKPVRTHQETVQPLAGIRKVIANRMHQSLSESAQTNTRMDVDMTNAVAFRTQMNARLADQGIKISYLDIIVAACAKALIEHPQANCSLQADGIHYKNYANVGVAVDTERGLVVPVIRDADVLSLTEIHKTSGEMVDKARRGALLPDDISGGTFTVSNLGMFEVDSFTAIVNPPETCILAVSRIADKVVALDGQMVIRPMMNICLSYDHRVIDGAPSAKFLRTVKHYLENPVWLMMD